MEVKNLFDPSVKQEIIDRINKLTPQTQRQWGKMNVEQMLAHVQLPISCAYGTHQVKGSFLLKLLGPLFKSVLYNEKPYKQSLPTDKSYVVVDTKDFEKEKQGLLEKLSMFSNDNIVLLNHPVWGKMSKEQWSKATWKHLDHHLKQFGV
ncbi:MAG TPA: DUF1569 domain-containing protein [Chitinophagaceae bacterium]